MKRRRYRYLLAVCLVSVFLYLSYESVQRFVATVYIYPARAEFNLWEQGKAKGTYQQWLDIKQRYETARTWEPRNPDLKFDLARVLSYRTEDDPVTDHEWVRRLQKSLALDVEGLGQRPTWPYAWGHFIAIKAAFKQFDADFNRGLQSLWQYGPAEPSLLILSTRIGLENWQHLTKETQKAVLHSLRNGLIMQPKQTLQAAKSVSQLKFACNAVEQTKKSQKLCAKMLKVNNAR